LVQPKLLDELVRQVAVRRRKARWLTWTAAAAALLLGFGGAVAARSVFVESPPPASSVRPTTNPAAMTQVLPSSFEATVALNTQAWGTEITMACTYHEEPAQGVLAGPGGDDADGNRLALVVVGRDGTKSELATWTAVEGGTAYPAGSTALPLEQIAAVQVIAAKTGNVLLQRSL
jgi:hypothetical protein